MGPYKCPECGIWWAGLEHRCQPAQFATSSTPELKTYTYTCSCVYNWRGIRTNPGACPAHDGRTFNSAWDGHADGTD